MNFKTGMLVMLVGIAVIWVAASSVAGYTTCAYCQIYAGSSHDAHLNSGEGDRTASCYLSNICGFYDGYVDGTTGEGSYYSDPDRDCSNAKGESLETRSYEDYYNIAALCYY